MTSPISPPWADYPRDEYDEAEHGVPEQKPPAAQRWYGCLLALVLTAGLVLAAFAIKEVMIWLM